jgi:hypothetical protein
MTTDPVNSNIKTFKFGLVRGDKGEKGDKGDAGGAKGEKGDKGETGSGADALSIAGLVLGSAGFAVSIGTALALFAEQLGLSAVVAGTQAGSQGILATRVKALEDKTIDMYFDSGSTINPLLPRIGAYFQFKRDVIINNGSGTDKIILKPEVESIFSNDLKSNGTITAGYYLKSNYLEVGNSTNTFLKIIADTFNVGYKTSTSSTKTNINSDTINIGCSSTASTINIGVGDTLTSTTASNTINIGNAASTVNIYGNFAQFTKQERKFTKPKLPFLG